MRETGSFRRLGMRARRFMAALLLAHYAAATWIIPVLHAAFGDDRPVRAAHVEQQGDKSCQPVHNHLNCSAFSVARLLAAPPPVVRVPAGDVRIAALPVRNLESLPSATAWTSLGSRAPPVA